jgi:hypothetical protein
MHTARGAAGQRARRRQPPGRTDADHASRGEAVYRICRPLPRFTALVQVSHPHASYCPTRADSRGTRREPRPGLSVNPSMPCSRNRCTHL